MDSMQSCVDSLYEFRDHFFATRDLSQAQVKQKEVNQRMNECIKQLDDISITLDPEVKDKAHALYLRGRALNINPEHCAEAERLLSRAVKLDTSHVEAWNELGECHWKREDVRTAKTCFEGALQHKSNKVSLRNISIVMRLLPTNTSEDRLRNIEQGLAKAREAVQLDTSDGISWSILGNAYLMHFFTVSQNPRTLKLAMSAYKQAEKDIVATASSELYYNKGIALKYEEEYVAALESFERSKALDPTWKQPKEQDKALWQTLTNIKSLIDLKGKLKTKRFNSLMESIDSQKGLGPYGGGSYSSSQGKSISLKEVQFRELTEGLNENKVVLGKVICSVHSEDTVPFTFCLTDRTGHIVAVNLYNLAPGKGVIIGDSVAIAEPYFSHISVNKDNKNVSFDLIRVDSPLVLVINGKKAAQDLQAGIELSTFTKSN